MPVLEVLELPTKITGPLAGGLGISAITDAVAGAIAVTEQWATELDEIGDIMGGTAKEGAALNFVLRKSGTDTAQLTKGMTILEKGLIEVQGTYRMTAKEAAKLGVAQEGVYTILGQSGKALEKYGIKAVEANGKVKDQSALIEEISEKYNALGTQQERVTFLTDVFGKSGAELIDFFDTLAAEGGLDKVIQKVEDFGLAIDPDRYEQFNRSLEELKLIGTGLAVQFTEKLMPVLERFLEWTQEIAPRVQEFAKRLFKAFEGGDFGKIDSFIAELIGTQERRILKWIAEGGPEKISDQIVSWIDNISEGAGIDSKALRAAQRMLRAIVRAVEAIDWGGIATAIDKKVGESIGKVDWKNLGKKFGDWLERGLTDGFDAPDMRDDWAVDGVAPGIAALQTFLQSDTVTSIGQALTDLFVAAAGQENIDAFNTMEQVITERLRTTAINTETEVTAWLQRLRDRFVEWVTVDVPAFMNTLEAKITGGIQTSMNTLEANVTTGLQTAAATFMTWVTVTIPGHLNTLKTNLLNRANEGMQAMHNAVDTWIGNIAKLFEERTGSWATKAANAFTRSKNAIINVIQGIVDEINGILRKIKTAFNISFTFSTRKQPDAEDEDTGTNAGGGGLANPNPHHSYAGNTFQIPTSVGWEGMSLGALGTVGGGETVRITPRGQDVQQVAVVNWDGFPLQQMAALIVQEMHNA